jgi:hypothetical protein
MANYFDDILATFENEDDRTQFKTLAEKNSRVKKIADEMGEFNDWYSKSWDAEHNMPKNEHLQAQRINDLEKQVSEGSGDVDFAKMDSWLDQKMAERGLAKTSDVSATLAQKEAEVTGLVNRMGDIAIEVPYLNQRHDKEYGELFDPVEYMKGANEARMSPRDYYDKFTADKREARNTANVDARIAAAEKAAREKALQEVSMSHSDGGRMPTVDGGNEMSAFQRDIMKRKSGQTADGSDTAGMSLNDPAVARAAAANWGNK